jgi:hypothetical protein
VEETEDTVGELMQASPVKHVSRETMPVQAGEITPNSMIQTAIERGASVDQIEKLIELKERCDANDAKKAFAKAVSAFKKKPPTVIKDLTNSQYGSKYSSISNLVNTVNKGLSKHGLSIRFDYPVSEDPNLITVTCIMSHSGGHSESVTASGPPDDSGKKNPLQQRKSTRTYLKIETFEAITGIASQEANIDDDGTGSEPVEYINEKQLADLKALEEDVGADHGKFCLYMGVTALKDIPAKDYQKAVTALEAKRGK